MRKSEVDKRKALQKGDVCQVFNTYAILEKPEASLFNSLRMAVRDRTVFGRYKTVDNLIDDVNICKYLFQYCVVLASDQNIQKYRLRYSSVKNVLIQRLLEA